MSSAADRRDLRVARTAFSLRAPRTRALLAKDLPTLPDSVAEGASTYWLSIVATCWLDADERIALRDADVAPTD